MESFEVSIIDGQVAGQRNVSKSEAGAANIEIIAVSGDMTGEVVNIGKDDYEALASTLEPVVYEGKIIEKEQYDEIQSNLSKMQGLEPDPNK